PGGGTADKPVGLVHLSCALEGSATEHQRCVFAGDRNAVREATVAAALDMALAAVTGQRAIA
ncbi:MAG: damage-inducible protein CinA, partial [Rhodospirillaceae bacterium]|nr:damage-inducible protein CinA [Rhodospirillaceae bacterium]